MVYFSLRSSFWNISRSVPGLHNSGQCNSKSDIRQCVMTLWKCMVRWSFYLKIIPKMSCNFKRELEKYYLFYSLKYLIQLLLSTAGQHDQSCFNQLYVMSMHIKGLSFKNMDNAQNSKKCFVYKYNIHNVRNNCELIGVQNSYI